MFGRAAESPIIALRDLRVCAHGISQVRVPVGLPHSTGRGEP